MTQPLPLSVRLKTQVSGLYRGAGTRARRFRYGLMTFDIVTIMFIVATQPLPASPLILVLDILIGLIVLADLMARLWISPQPARHLLHATTLADIVVVFSLLLAPLLAGNLAFLRVLRLVRLLHSYQVLRDLRQETPFFRHNEEVIVSLINLVTFIFVFTALVFELQSEANPAITGYVDALYFTVATLTTTGFGDITLTGSSGRVLSVVIMVVGVALFLRLVQTVFRPRKVRHTCPSCGLSRHELDAVHCKHCGETLRIKTEGDS
ncbi:two pore domain potassium channel family protein [Roseospira marina]|uniref:Two pore domain potassium channel family protein n=1 Tax=Roseospira marina TaxID=140057 RepID=A0A5M6IBI8_9PROT|nr:potassium channel family protein [Roseospira marina]KAA5605327.1 two pore domain potassium channel family protein [Roseospira marina]MBB4314798.1 voltage-gated potassium channel [Roseospira marina]MBB5087787.1 voltage-gated potassium channel [Roseospira marina]